MRGKPKKKKGSGDTELTPRLPGLPPAPPITHERLVVDAFTDICRESTPRGMIDRCVAAIKRLLRVEAASCFLHDAATGELLAHYGGAEGSRSITVPFGSGVVGAAFASGQSEVVRDAHADPRFNSTVDAATGFHTRNLLSVPVLQHKKSGAAATVVAVLQALNSPPEADFGPKDVALLE